jgi:hypothetical protein
MRLLSLAFQATSAFDAPEHVLAAEARGGEHSTTNLAGCDVTRPRHTAYQVNTWNSSDSEISTPDAAHNRRRA